jgi:hypothetical protein
MTNHSHDLPDIPIETLAQTENYTIWTAVEPDEEKSYHLELGPVTAHFFEEEWGEFVGMIRTAAAEEESAGSDDEEDVEVELDWGSLYFTREEWGEFVQLIGQV